MKKHTIIPVFLPHEGCPNDCVFCNQKKITARAKPLEKEAVCYCVDELMGAMGDKKTEVLEIAFFGGSFTGIPIEKQREYLAIAKGYKDKGLIQNIRLSTRPDYIDSKILDCLKKYEVDIIELGVQSMDDEVLRLSKRGHNSSVVYKSSELIQTYGFTLGLQLMTGLPGDTPEKSVDSARKAAGIGPDIARIYPTMVLKETELAELYAGGEYELWPEEKTLGTVKDMCRILRDAGVNVIRIGLKSTDHITNGGEVLGGNYHPAFRQLVDGELAKEAVLEQLEKLGISQACQIGAHTILTQNKDEPERKFCVELSCNEKCFSNLIGHKGVNKKYFENNWPNGQFKYKVNNELAEYEYKVVVLEGTRP